MKLLDLPPQLLVFFILMSCCLAAYILNLTIIALAKGYRRPPLRLFMLLTVSEIISAAVQLLFPFIIGYGQMEVSPSSGKMNSSYSCQIQAICVNSTYMWAVLISIYMGLMVKNVMEGKQYFLFAENEEAYLFVLIPLLSFAIMGGLSSMIHYRFEMYGQLWEDREEYYICNIPTDFLGSDAAASIGQIVLFSILITIDFLSSFWAIYMICKVKALLRHLNSLGIEYNPLLTLNYCSGVIILIFNINIWNKLIEQILGYQADHSTNSAIAFLYFLPQLIICFEGYIMTQLLCICLADLLLPELSPFWRGLVIWIRKYSIFSCCCLAKKTDLDLQQLQDSCHADPQSALLTESQSCTSNSQGQVVTEKK